MKKYISIFAFAMLGISSCKKTSTSPNNSATNTTTSPTNKISDEYLILNDGMKSDTFNYAYGDVKESSYLGKNVTITFLNDKTKNDALDSITKSTLKIPKIQITLPHDLSVLTIGVKPVLQTENDVDVSAGFDPNYTGNGAICLFNFDYYKIYNNNGIPITVPSSGAYTFDASSLNDNELDLNTKTYKNNITYVGPIQKIEGDYAHTNYYIIEGDFITKTTRWGKMNESKIYTGRYRFKIKYKI